ncbi:MAG TPA: anti-sigma factor [Casimicrobiaceae bacterium]|nr:anti-sigma factor [Casimicrobiaceae bacterium]
MLGRLTHLVSCKEASRLLSQREDRALAFADRIKLALHLSVCIACSRFARQLPIMRKAMARYRSQDA